MNATGRAALVPLILVLGACHTFRPADRASVRSGEQVRVTLTSEAAAAQIETFGDYRTSVEGVVQETGSGGLGMTVARPSSAVEPGGTNLRSYVQIPWDDVTGVETKHFSASRTALVVGGAALAAVAILSVADFSGGNDGDPPGTDNQRVRIPLFSWAR
jgi:hypothetical protein